MSKRMPVYLSEYELLMLTASMRVAADRIKEFEAEVSELNKLTERLEAELATFEE